MKDRGYFVDSANSFDPGDNFGCCVSVRSLGMTTFLQLIKRTIQVRHWGTVDRLLRAEKPPWVQVRKNR